MALCCELSKPGASVQWKKDAVLLWPGNKYEVKQNGCKLHLKIYDFNAEDCGVYKCCSCNVETTATVGIKGPFSSVFLFKAICSACLLHCMYENKQISAIIA